MTAHDTHVADESMEITWHPTSRVAAVQFRPNTALGGRQGVLLVESLARWIGTEGGRFAVLADTKGVRTADSEYRVTTRDFFVLHRDRAYIAVTNMGPVIRIVADMFRVGTGIHLKGFADEARARAWLRSNGIAA